MFGDVDNMKSIHTDFKQAVLRRIFGPKRDELTGELRKLQNDVLNDLYSSSKNVCMINSSRI